MFARDTHKNPVENTIAIMIFFLVGSCSADIQRRGRIRIAKSEMTLKKPLVMNQTLVLSQ